MSAVIILRNAHGAIHLTGWGWIVLLIIALCLAARNSDG